RAATTWRPGPRARARRRSERIGARRGTAARPTRARDRSRRSRSSARRLAGSVRRVVVREEDRLLDLARDPDRLELVQHGVSLEAQGADGARERLEPGAQPGEAAVGGERG